MATEEQAEVPAYKPSPFMKAAAQIIEASEGHVPDDLHWDPLTMSYGGGTGLPSDAIELPTELMMNLVGPGLAAVRNVKPTPEVPLAPSQERARKRLQQRKEAAAREAAEKAAQQEKEVEEPLDESWIDQLEQKDAKKKAGREKAVQIRKERKKARKADAAAKLEALESVEAQEEEVEAVAEPESVQPEPVEEIEDEEEMQPVEQSKQRRKRQARQAAKEREEAEQARREEERREEEARLEAERKQREAEKARLEQERLEQEQKRLEEQREAEKKEEELRQKREAEKREAERREAEKRKAEEAKERKEQKEREAKAKAREAREAEEREKHEAKAEAKEEKNNVDFEEARADGDRRRKNEARDAEPKARQGRKQDKDEAKETGEQPTQVKSLRQTLTPSQLRRQQRKRQREARRAAEAAAREEDESEEEPYEVKPKQPERRQSERSTERERATERECSNEWPKTKESRLEVKAETETEARPKAEEGKRARGGSVSSIASLDSQARKEEDSEPAEAQRTGSDLRKDAEAFPTPRSAAGSFDSRVTQELDQNMMQPVMGITTLMISQVPKQTDAESFRRQLDSWGFIGTYNFFYMPPDVSEGWGGRCVFINFIDQAMANMCMSAFQQCPGEGVAAPYSVQGLENNIAHFSQFVGAGDMVNGPLIVPTPTPSAWALNGAQAMINSTQGKFSPQIRGQFHKTKMCAFHKKKKCTMGVACPFAHCKEELNAPPDLSKTKLCVNFFRRKCNDIHCKFAHGHSELRATGSVYKTELCRAWASGTCKAGDTCRYAHGVKELRGAQMGMGYMGFPMEDDYMSMDGQMGCDVMGGLQGIWEDEAAAMQHYNGHNGYGSMSSYPAGSGEQRGRSNPSSNFSSGQPQDGTADVNDAMSDMGLSDVSTLCPGEGRLSRQQTAPPTASFPANGQAVHSNVVLRVKGTFMESVFLDEEVERLPLRRSWSDGDLPQLQDMEGEQEL